MSVADQAGVEYATPVDDGSLEALMESGESTPQRQQLRRVCLRSGVLMLIGTMFGTALLLGGGHLSTAEDPSMAAVASGQVRSAKGADGHLIGLDAASDTAAKYTTCAIDVDQAIFYLVQAGNFIKFATLDCNDTVTVDAAGRRTCAANVGTVIASMGWTASYIAAAVNTCGVADNVPAACAAGLTTLVALMGEFAFISSSITDACEIDPERRLQAFPTLDMNATGVQKPQASLTSRPSALAEAKSFFSKYSEKLKADAAKIKAAGKRGLEDGDEEVDPRRGAQISQCVVDADVGITYVGRIGTQSYYLSQECPSQAEADKKTCILDIFNVISSMAWAAQFLALLAVDCPQVGNAKAGCAATVADFVATVAALGPTVNGISDSCQWGLPAHEEPLPVGQAHWAER